MTVIQNDTFSQQQSQSQQQGPQQQQGQQQQQQDLQQQQQEQQQLPQQQKEHEQQQVQQQQSQQQQQPLPPPQQQQHTAERAEEAAGLLSALDGIELLAAAAAAAAEADGAEHMVRSCCCSVSVLVSGTAIAADESLAEYCCAAILQQDAQVHVCKESCVRYAVLFLWRTYRRVKHTYDAEGWLYLLLILSLQTMRGANVHDIQLQQLSEADQQRLLQLCDALFVHLAANSKAELLQALARIKAADELPDTVATGACSICKESLKRLSLLAYRLVGKSGLKLKCCCCLDAAVTSTCHNALCNVLH
jgi:DNA mismatch repair ATPase MutL